MKKSTWILLAFLLPIIFLCFQVSSHAADPSVQDADAIWSYGLTVTPIDLDNTSHIVLDRPLSEYANAALTFSLTENKDLSNTTTSVIDKPLLEYPNAAFTYYLTEIPQNLKNLPTETRPLIEFPNTVYTKSLMFPTLLINDTLSPLITNVTIENISDNSATIKWDTNEISIGIIKYGTTTETYPFSKKDDFFIYNHNITLTELQPATTHYFIINCSDQSGNWAKTIEYTFMTTGPKITVNLSLPIIPEDTNGNPMVCPDNPACSEVTNITLTITDPRIINSVTIDLSSLGWPNNEHLTHIQGTNIWYILVNAAPGTAVHDGTRYVPHCLVINASDEYGNWNTTTINVTVWKNGDVNGDGVITLYDATYLAKWYFNQPGFEYLPENVADVSGDCQITLYDATYLAKWYFNQPGFEMLK